MTRRDAAKPLPLVKRPRDVTQPVATCRLISTWPQQRRDATRPYLKLLNYMLNKCGRDSLNGIQWYSMVELKL